MQHNVWLSRETKCQWPMFNSPPPVVSKSPSASKAGSTKAWKSRIQNLPIKDSHVGSQQVRALHTATLLTRKWDLNLAGVHRGAPGPAALPPPPTTEIPPGWQHGLGVPWNSRDSKLTHQTGSHPCPKKTAYLNLNFNFKIEGKNSLYLLPSPRTGKLRKLSRIVLKLRPYLDSLIKKRGTTTKKHQKSLVK